MNLLLILLLFAGFALVAICWSFFRLPGVPFLTFYTPIWKAKEFVTPIGIYLWWASVTLMAMSSLGLFLLGSE